MINRVTVKMDNKVYSIQVDAMTFDTETYCNEVQFTVSSYMNGVTYALVQDFEKHKEAEVIVHIFKQVFKLRNIEVMQFSSDLVLVHLYLYKCVKPNIALDDTIGGFYDR